MLSTGFVYFPNWHCGPPSKPSLLWAATLRQGPDKDAFQELARPGLEDLPEALPLLEKALYSDHDAGVAAANALEPLAKEEPEKVLPCLLKRPRGDSSGRHLLLLALLKSIAKNRRRLECPCFTSF